MENLPKYIVRPHDFSVWERFNDTNLYRTYEKPEKEIKNRQDPYNHWTYDNLVNGWNFFPIEENQLQEYVEKHDYEISFLSWQCRNDGHGGSKGGTKEDYEEYLERVKRFNESHPNWKQEQNERR